MKFEVAKQDLEAALSVASVAVESGVSDLSSHYLFRFREGLLEVLTYGMRLFARAPFIASVDAEEGEAFTVEAWRLDKWMAGVGDGVLTLSADGSGDVHAKGPRSRVRFRSLDPSKFPYWDETLATAEAIGSAPARTITNALNLARWFVSADDTAKPELCQIEAVNGVIWATDRRALSSVEIPLLPELGIRVPGKAVASVLKYLGDKATQQGDLEVLQAERSFEDGGGAFAIFSRADGAYLGVTRPTSQFPALNVDREAVNDAVILVDVEELNAGVSVLLASAPKGHEAVTFSYDPDSDKVSISMPCEAGGTDTYPLALTKVQEGADNFDVPFTVDYPYIVGIASSYGVDQIEFGICKRGRGGYISSAHADEGETGNRYFSVVVWRT